MKKNIYRTLNYIIVFFTVILIVNICLFVSCLFDSKVIRKNVVESSNIIKKEGYFYPIQDIFLVTNNNYTDAQIVNELYSIDHNHPFNSYMKARRNYSKKYTKHEIEDVNGDGLTINYIKNRDLEIAGEEYDTINELEYFLKGKIHSSINSGRYWHGYIMVYRPLMIFFNIKQIRLLLLMSYIILFITLIYLIYRRFDIYKAIIFGTSLICSAYFSASYSLESSPVFLIMMISSIIFLLRIDKIKQVGIFMFVVGCLVSIFDYLTVPLITLGMICSLYVLKMIEDKKDWKECFKFVIITSLLWLGGYLSAWIFKWILYDLTIPSKSSMLKVGFTQSFFRVQRVSNTICNGINIWQSISQILYNMPIYILGTLIIIAVLKKFKYNINIHNRYAIVFILISLMPITWYIVLANHTIIHYHFVHRHVMVFMVGTLLATYEVLFDK